VPESRATLTLPIREGLPTNKESALTTIPQVLTGRHDMGSIAELERSLIVERIRAGMRAKIEGRRLGRAPLDVDRNALARDRLAGMSLTDVAKKYRISRASVVRVVREAKRSQLVAAA
jgi:DNA invertase Pin-like site-specific DNA recombinase